MPWTEEKLSSALDQHRSWLMAQPGVAGVGIGLSAKGMAVQIMTDHLDNAGRKRVRERLGKVPVEFVQSGPIEAQ